MSGQTNERAFESYVETMLLDRGWQAGTNAEWDLEHALFPARVCHFIEATQPKPWAEMRALHGAGLEKLIIGALAKELDLKGTLHVLRHGFKFYGKTFRLAYFKPAHGLNDEVQALYAQNRLTITRQVACHPGKHDTVDILFAVNGLPVASCELKNPGTGQSWRHAVRQYQQDRDPRAPLFGFKTRALVHFAADPDEVHMTTRLRGADTHFLPFNRGSHPGEVQCGAGNPQHPSGYRTGYFWDDVLSHDSFLDILGHFMFVEKKEEKVDDGPSSRRGGGQRRIAKEALIFPRYHQLDAVRRIVDAARGEGPGQNYLIQHSAGSGKTNSISWLSHRLASLHDGQDRKVFDCVVVITDRRVLDQQLQDAIYQIEHAQGVVKAIDQDSKQLAAALIDGTKIVITTLQKFPFVLRGLLHVAGAQTQEQATAEEKAQARAWEAEIAKRRYAVIVDEAHSSQTGETARELKAILGAGAADDAEGETDWEDRLNQVMASRGRQQNLSFFAFTATPKGKTLELFGRPGAGGTPEAFHLYSMRQAIEEGFILDVLTSYTTYATYYRLLKAAEDDPNLPKKKAARALAKFMSLHPHNIEQKTEVIVEHFRRSVMHRLGGRGKAMVVTSSRLHAVRYKLAFERYLAENGYRDVRPLVAFSGKVTDPDTGLEYTEPGMNIDVVTGKPIGEAALPARFETPDYQVLLVANKYQTGFDQPLLCAMYVDKRLDGVQAVQTLSRLNRMIPGKDAPFVLDFVNDAEEHLQRLQALLRQDRACCGFGPVHDGCAEARARPGAGLLLERGRGVCPGILQADGAARRRRPCAHAAASATGGGPLQGDRRPGQAGGVSGEALRLCAGLRLSEPDRPLRRSGPGDALQLRPVPAAPLAARSGRDDRQGGRRGGAAVLPNRAGVLGSDRHQGRRPAVCQEPERSGYRQGGGREGPAIRDHRGAQRALRHAVQRRRPALLRADQGKGL